MRPVAGNGADGRNLHAGQAVGRDIIHAGEGCQLLPQGLVQRVSFLHLHEFPAGVILILQQILTPVSELRLGHFFYVHRVCISGNAEQQNPGQTQGKGCYKRLFPIPGEIHQSQAGHGQAAMKLPGGTAPLLPGIGGGTDGLNG